MKQATELEYLKWFFINTDFGPAHEDVVDCMEGAFTKETGKEVPTAWKQ
jgi:hypothetical protein